MQSDSVPTIDKCFPSCIPGTVNMLGRSSSFWMANCVGEVGWRVQDVMANPTQRAVTVMTPGLCDMVSLLVRTTVIALQAHDTVHALPPVSTMLLGALH